MKKQVDAARLDIVPLIAFRALFRNPIVRHVSDRNSVPLQLKVAQTSPEHTDTVRRVERHSTCSKDNFVRENEESGHQDARPKEDAGTPLEAGRVGAPGENAEGTRAFAQRENVADRMLCSSDKYLSLALRPICRFPPISSRRSATRSPRWPTTPSA